jgi:hypothetical protein
VSGALFGSWHSSVLCRQEAPAGAVDGVNAVFTLSRAPLPGSLSIYINGLFNTTHSIIAETVTFTAPPPDGAVVWAVYLG